MLLEKILEKSIVDRVAESFAGTGADVFGSWQTVAAGEVKDVESVDAAVVIRVNVAPRSYATQYAPMCSVEASIEMDVRADMSPDGSALADSAEKLFSLLQTWQTDMDAAMDDLTVDGFTPTATRLDGGTGPTFDASACKWQVTQTITIMGTLTTEK